MKPPKRLNACWDSLDTQLRSTCVRLSPARKRHPMWLAFGAAAIPVVCYLTAYIGLGSPPAPLSFDVIAAALVLMLVAGFPIFACFFLQGVFFTTVTIYPLECAVCKSWGPYHVCLWRKRIPIGLGPWQLVPAMIRAESAAFLDIMDRCKSGSPMAMMSGLQDLVKTDEDLCEIDYPVWGLVSGSPTAPDTRMIVWFRDANDAQTALHQIWRAGGKVLWADQAAATWSDNAYCENVRS